MKDIQPTFLKMLQNNDLEFDEDPYFPEELPKIANLGALVRVFINIINSIIEFIKPSENYSNKKRKIAEILKKTIRYMTKIRNIMFFIVVKNGKHYKMAMNNVLEKI